MRLRFSSKTCLTGLFFFLHIKKKKKKTHFPEIQYFIFLKFLFFFLFFFNCCCAVCLQRPERHLGLDEMERVFSGTPNANTYTLRRKFVKTNSSPSSHGACPDGALNGVQLFARCICGQHKRNYLLAFP